MWSWGLRVPETRKIAVYRRTAFHNIMIVIIQSPKLLYIKLFFSIFKKGKVFSEKQQKKLNAHYVYPFLREEASYFFFSLLLYATGR